MFPVGHLTKPEVRAHAERLNLQQWRTNPTATKSALCRIDAAGFVERRLPDEPRRCDRWTPKAASSAGTRDCISFTVGQRKGLGLSTGAPLYVLRLEPGRRELVVGSREELGGTTLTASSVNWISAHRPMRARASPRASATAIKTLLPRSSRWLGACH